MTEMVTILCPFSRSEGDTRLLAELRGIYPSGCRVELLFDATFAKDDGRLIDVLRAFDRSGWRMQEVIGGAVSSESKFYDVEVNREYDDQDITECDFIKLVPKDVKEFCGVGRDPGTGQVVVDIQLLNRRGGFGIAAPCRYLVSDKVVQLLDSSGLEGIVLQPTLLDHRREPGGKIKEPRPEWEDYGMFPWYELTAEVELPAAVKAKGMFAENACQMDLANGIIEFKGPRYGNFETHYRSSDLTKVPKFDLARVAEFDDVPGLEQDRMLIASKRFYQFCLKHKLNASWVPVRIEPD